MLLLLTKSQRKFLHNYTFTPNKRLAFNFESNNILIKASFQSHLYTKENRLMPINEDFSNVSPLPSLSEENDDDDEGSNER